MVGHPFDTVKVHIQTQSPHNPLYRGTFHCLRTIIAKDSVRGLYRGVTSPMSGVALVNAIIFGVYGNVQRYSSAPDSIKSHFIAGSVAGLAQTTVCSPMELTKTCLQLQNNSTSAGPKFTNPFQCLGHIWKKGGFRGVYKGFGITAIRDVPGLASYFVSYEFMMRSTQNPGVLYTLVAGGMAGVFSWILTVPMDVIKSRIQADGLFGPKRYDGIMDCIRQSYKAEGCTFLTKGLGSTVLRAFPMNAACFYVVSWFLKTFDTSASVVDIEIPQTDIIPLVLNNNQSDLIVQSTISKKWGNFHNIAACSNDALTVSTEFGYYNIDVDRIIIPLLSETDFISLG